MIGGLLFALFDLTSWQATTGQQAKNEITVTEGHIQALALSFQKTRQRPPGKEELDKLVERYVREEVFYREAMAMGLDRDDGIVRKRMVQKLEFISEDLAGLEKPDQETLQAYLDANVETYRQDARYSFLQVYVASRTSAEVDELLAKLRSGQIEADQAGHTIMIQTTFENET